MEVIHRCKASRVSPQVEGEDVISSMPENVVTHIMNCLPLRDAVRTSILSTNWRFKWTLLTELILNYRFFMRFNHFDKANISRLLHHLKGVVTKFSLCITNAMKVDVEDIHHWVMFLSRLRGFKDLDIIYHSQSPLKFPTHLFSCLDLKHLRLNNCVLSPPPYFRGFPKLMSLILEFVSFHDYRCGEFITQCPLVENLNIFHLQLRGEVKLAEIAKLENVKVLSLALCLLDNMTMVRLSSALQHLSSLLPKIQELHLCFKKCKFLSEAVAQNPVCITYPFLKTLSLYNMNLSCVSMLSCAYGMLFGCANLQTLNITGIYKDAVHPPAITFPEVDCSTVGQLKLRNVGISSIKGLKNEICLIKYMLACSPDLKSITINWLENNDGTRKYKFKYKLASKLLKLHRASPKAEIIF